MPESALHLDASDWPLVRIEPLRTPTEQDVSSFLDAFEHLVEERRDHYAIVLDLHAGVAMPMERRKQLQGGVLKGETGRFLRAEAMIMPSAVKRALMGLVLKFAGPDHAMKLFGDETRARRWARKQLDHTRRSTRTDALA